MAGEEEEKATGARFDSPVSRAEECGLYLRVRGIRAPKIREEPELYLNRVILTPCLQSKQDIHAGFQSHQSVFAEK